MSQHDVIVIGSGIGGLTAALTCARAGRDVLVLEAGKQFGGYINPFARRHFWFDTGIHYIGDCGPGQPLHRQFERLGLLDDLEFKELNPDGFDRYSFPDYEVRMCKGADEYRARLTRDFPHEARGLKRFFELLDDVDVTVRSTMSARPGLPLLRVIPKVPRLLKYHRATFSEILAEHVSDPRLRAVLAAPGGDIGLPPGKASGLVMLALLGHFLGGAYFPVGGTKRVRDAFVRALTEHGATMKRNTPVGRILSSSGRVTGVRTQTGAEYTAPVVISNADVVTTLRDLVSPGSLPRRTAQRASTMEAAIGSLCVFIGTDLQPDEHGIDDANIWSYTGYDIDALYAPVLGGELSESPPFFLTVPTLKDPSGSHAPAGKHTVELITFAPFEAFAKWKHQKTLKRDAEYNDLKNELGLSLTRRAEKYLPGLSDHLEIFEVATPLTNVSYVGAARGSIYGPAHTPEQVGLGRFRTQTPIDGLFLCGSGVLGAGIATCMTSGTMAGRAALSTRSTLSHGFRRLARTARLQLAT